MGLDSDKVNQEETYAGKVTLMPQLQITRYPVKHPLLKAFIKYFWVMRSEHEDEIIQS